MSLTVFDCFAGIGGFRMAFEREGFKIVGFCEKDKYAAKLYKAYYNCEGEYYAEDATKIITGELPDFDILTGGFPCQAFSIAGKRQGFEDSRGTLFFELARILRDKRPRYFVFENVKGLLTHDGRKTFQSIIGVLAELGYSVEWQVLNSKYFGVPHNRERIYISGYSRGETKQKVFPFRKSCESDNNKRQGLQNSFYLNCLRSTDYKTNHNLICVANINPSGRGQNGNVYSSKGVLPTITTNKGEGIKIIDNKSNLRRITPLESFRAQGFPDDIVEKAYEIGISDTQLYKMAGNSVTVNVVQEIAKRIN